MKKLALFVILFILLENTYCEEGVKFGVFIAPHMSWLVPDIKTIDKDGARLNVKGGLIVDFFR